MDTLTQNRGLECPPPELFLPPESPLPMAKQQLRSFQREGKAAVSRSGFRRACIFIGMAAITAVGCYKMYEVVSVGSRNAMLLPTYNEDPDRIMARLLAMYESVAEAERGASFDWFVLSDTTD